MTVPFGIPRTPLTHDNRHTLHEVPCIILDNRYRDWRCTGESLLGVRGGSGETSTN